MATTIRDQVRTLKRENILDVSADLFFDQGYHGTSIEAICSALGVTKPFIYYHFAKKDDILHAIYLSSVECALEVVRSARRDGDTHAARLKLLTERYVDLATSKMRARIALNSREKNLLPKDVMRDVNHSKRLFLDEVIDLVRTGVADGAFTVGDVEVAAQSLLGMLNWVITYYRASHPPTREQIAAELSANALRMMGVRADA